MLNISTAMSEALFDNIRPQQYFNLNIAVIDPTAASDVTITPLDNGVFYSNTDTVMFRNVPDVVYATFEPGRWDVRTEFLVPSEDSTLYNEGYVGDTLSNSSGVWETPTGIRCTFSSAAHTFAALTLIFDSYLEWWPESVQIISYRGGVQQNTITAYPDDYEYVVYLDDAAKFEDVDEIGIHFLTTAEPYRRARLQSVSFGYFLDIDSSQPNSSIASVSLTKDCDPLSRWLPTEELSFTLFNHDGKYNPDNPFGIWRDMQERIPITVSFGQRQRRGRTWKEVYEEGDTWRSLYQNGTTWRELYEGGGIEWIPMGVYYLNSLPQTRQRTVTFTATTVVGLLDREYREGAWGTTTFYDLAETVLEASGVPKLLDSTEPWLLGDNLKAYSTDAPLPVMPSRDLLQLIANATGSVMFTDREGRLHIDAMSSEDYPDFLLDFSSSLELPNLDMIAALGGVELTGYNYTDIQETRDLVSTEYAAVAGERVSYEFTNPIRDVTVSISGGGTYTVNAYTVDVYPETTGTVTITINAREVRPATYTLYTEVELARDTAVWATVDNQLITDAAQARYILEHWKNYLLLRSTYSFDYNGHPEIDVLDSIRISTQFTEALPVYVLKSDLTYTGNLWGNIEVKSQKEAYT